MLNLTPSQLRQAADLKEKIAGLEKQLAALVGSVSKATPTKPAKKGGMSAAGKARISAAAKLRWAKIKAAKLKPAAKPAVKPVAAKPAKKKGMSAAAKAKLSAMMKARWAAKKKAAVKK